jgi:hypothetical protein
MVLLPPTDRTCSSSLVRDRPRRTAQCRRRGRSQRALGRSAVYPKRTCSVSSRRRPRDEARDREPRELVRRQNGGCFAGASPQSRSRTCRSRAAIAADATWKRYRKQRSIKAGAQGARTIPTGLLSGLRFVIRRNALGLLSADYSVRYPRAARSTGCRDPGLKGSERSARST